MQPTSTDLTMASPNSPPSSGPSSIQPRSSLTTSATPPTFYEAAHAVLNTNELLCEIVGYLTLEDIVASTNVCRIWRCGLKASVAIQRALFLAPTDIRRITTDIEDFPKRIEDFRKQVQDLRREFYVVVGEVNPFFTRICCPVLSNDTYRHKDMCPDEHEPMSPRESSEQPAGLWRDMLITQPPTSHVRVCMFLKEDQGTQDFVPCGLSSYSFRCEDGIRMGQLYDSIESSAQEIWTGLPVAVRVVMPNFHPEHKPVQMWHDWCWEVRDGKIVREIPPPPDFERYSDLYDEERMQDFFGSPMCGWDPLFEE